MESKFVIAASNNKYSHVGILVKKDKHWHVVHAVPGEADDGNDTIKIEPLNEFLRKDRCRGVLHKQIGCNYSVALSVAHYVVSKVGVRFDNDYELNDTTRYYCTELVWQAYLHQGLDITEGRRHGNYILPVDLIPVSK